MISHVEVMQECVIEANHAQFHMWKWCKKCVMVHDFTCGSDARVCDKRDEATCTISHVEVMQEVCDDAWFHMWKWCKSVW